MKTLEHRFLIKLWWRCQWIVIGRRGLFTYWCFKPSCVRTNWIGFDRVFSDLWFLCLGPLTISNHPIY